MTTKGRPNSLEMNYREEVDECKKNL